MRLFRTSQARGQFKPIAATRILQAAMMTLAPGGCSDEELANEHPACEQWLLVLSGRGTATVSSGRRRRRAALEPGSLLLIERGELHQIRQRGRKALRTINFYAPPAYQTNGDVRATAKRT